MNVLIVDDHALFRLGLEMLLMELFPAIRTSQATSASAAVEVIASGQRFDLVLMDWHMPEMAGLDALQAIRESLESGRIVVLSGDQSPGLIQTCIDNGASGFIPKDSSTSQLTEALSSVMEGKIFLPVLAQYLVPPPGVADQPANSQQGSRVGDAFPELTPRQCEVLELMARGLTNKSIARQLGNSSDTVKHHLSVIYQALCVSNRTEAVYMISQRGIHII